MLTNQITLSQNINTNTESFWDSVATMYSTSDLTTHKADFEMSILFDILKSTTNLHGLASFGVADGKRDPIQLLLKLKDDKKEMPQEIILNDISNEMLIEAKKNVGTFVKVDNCKYLHTPISKLSEVFSHNQGNNTGFVFGVYNAKYIMQSLRLYMENSVVIGTEFELFPLFFDGNNIGQIGTQKLSFNINNFQHYENDIAKMSLCENFYAFSIRTNKNFISHFFSAKSLKTLLAKIFVGKNVSCIEGQEDNSRYIVYIIKEKCKIDYLVTMINNVLGNIKYEEQIQSLIMLDSMF
jgi:hypothetical protein